MRAPESGVESKFGQVFRCPVCGAEVTVIRGASGATLAPRCCNRPMLLKNSRTVGYRCPVCGAEIVVIRQGGGELRPRCCNRDMVLRAA